jgi:hypothetical protein
MKSSRSLVAQSFAVALGGLFAAYAAEPAALVSNTNLVTGPAIQFDATTFNFGKVKQGEATKHSFIFTNIGKATLQILEVKPGCGCTTAGQWDKSVEPGATGAIPLQFNSAGFGGPVSKSAMVTCNDPVKSNLVLTISGNVWRPVDMTPSMAMFQVDPETQTNQVKVVKIVNNLEQPLAITNISMLGVAFHTELKETIPGKEFELHVTAVAPITNTTSTVITLKTTAPEALALSLTAYAMVQQPLIISPQQYSLSTEPLTNAVSQSVNIISRTGKPLRVTESKPGLPGVQVNIKETQPGRTFVVQAIFPVGFKLDPTQKTELQLETDNPKIPVVKVPVVAVQRVPTRSVTAAPPPTSAQAPGEPQSVSPTKRVVPVRNPVPAATKAVTQ